MSDCLPDIRISQLPRIDTIELDDLLVIDKQNPAGTNVYETKAITWGHALGIYPPGGGGGDGGGGDIIIPNPDHNIILNGTVKFLDGTELRPSITFIFDDNTGFYRPDNDTIGFTTGGSRVMVLKRDNLGLGTDYPKEKLHVEQGNILVQLGNDDNGLYLGSSNRGIGGDPSVQSTGEYDLTFHVDGTMYYKFTTTGALGVKNGNAMDVGDVDYVLASTGPSAPPKWRSKDDLFDLDLIISDIDNNYIGKGELKIYPQDTLVGNTTMSSGLDYSVSPDPCNKFPPNANSFCESGWNLNVDESVVRTGGNQEISGIKTFVANQYGTDSRVRIEAEAQIQVMENGKIDLENGSDFHFWKLDFPPEFTTSP